MGDTQSIPVLGEAVTAIDSGVKLACSGGVLLGAVATKPFMDKDENEEIFNASKQLLKGAGNSWVDYAEKNVIAARINAKIREENGDYHKAMEIIAKSNSSVENIVDSTPVVGHVKGIYHYLDHNIEHGNKCMLGATRGTAVLGVGALTGGLGGGALLAGSLGAGTGLAYDATASLIDSAMNDDTRLHGNIAGFRDFVKEDDPNQLVDSLLGIGGDFSTAVGAQQTVEGWKANAQKTSLKNALKEAQKMNPEIAAIDPCIATEDTINAAKNLNNLVEDGVVKGDNHVSSVVRDLDTNQVYDGYSQRARADINVKKFQKKGANSGFKTKTNAIKKARRGPTTFQEMHPEVKPVLKKHQHACAEHHGLHKLYKYGRGAAARVQICSVKLVNGVYQAVIRCGNCFEYGKAMGTVVTDFVGNTVVPVQNIQSLIVKGCACGALYACGQSAGEKQNLGN